MILLSWWPLQFVTVCVTQVALLVKNPPANAGDTEMWVQSLGREDPLEEEMATHSSTLAWKIPWMEGPGSYCEEQFVCVLSHFSCV